MRKFEDDKEVIALAVAKEPAVFCLMHKDLQKDDDFCLELVKKNK